MQAPQASEIGLEVDPGAIVSDGGGCRPGVQEQPRRQELRGGGQVGGDLLLEDRAGNLVDDTHPDRADLPRDFSSIYD